MGTLYYGETRDETFKKTPGSKRKYAEDQALPGM
jgi:hypothetical protein